jgi:putative hydrolase of the HAD superfamily
MIDAVTFDVWNTLVVHEFYDDRLRLHRARGIQEALCSGGYHCTWDQVVAAYDYTEDRLTEIWKGERDVGSDRHLALFLEGLGLGAADGLIEMIRDPYAHALLHFRPKLVDGAAQLLTGLKEDGYRIGLISNTGRTPGKTMRKVLEGYGLLDCFDAMTFSDEAGHIKPSPEIYRIALEELGARPDRTAHVGDNPLLDIYGAKACGMKAVHFTRYMDRFERYASKYYSANGRRSEPDCVVGSLDEVPAALSRLSGPEK